MYFIPFDQDRVDDCLELADVYPTAKDLCDRASATLEQFNSHKARLGDAQHWKSLARKTSKADSVKAKDRCFLASASNFAALEVECSSMLPPYIRFLKLAISTARGRNQPEKELRNQTELCENRTRQNNVLVAESLLKTLTATYGKVMTLLGSIDSSAHAQQTEKLGRAFGETAERYSDPDPIERTFLEQLHDLCEGKEETIMPDPRSMSMIVKADGISTLRRPEMVELLGSSAELLKIIDKGRLMLEVLDAETKKLNIKQWLERLSKVPNNEAANRLGLEYAARRCDIASELCTLYSYNSELAAAYERQRTALISLLRKTSADLPNLCREAVTTIQNNALVAEASAQDASRLLKDSKQRLEALSPIAFSGLDEVYSGKTQLHSVA